MKVLIVAQWVKIPGFEGAAAHHMEFAKALTEAGVEVHIIADSTEKSIGGAKVHPVNTKFPRPLLSYNTIWKIVEICKKEGIDVIHKRMDPGSGFSTFAAKKAGVPLVAEINFNPFSFERRGGILTDAVKPAVQYYPRILWAKFFLSRADAICCVSEVTKKALERHGIKKNFYVIPNGVDVKRFGMSSKRAVEKLKKSLDITGPVIEIVGGLGPRHGLDSIVYSATRIEKEFPEARFVIVGGIEKYIDYIERIKSKAPSNVIFAGRIADKELPLYLGMADICLAPFHEALNPAEPYGFCPIKILEYMGAGKPIVATKLSWIEELLEHGKNAILFSTPEEMVEGIETLLLDENLRLRIGKENRKKAEEKYSWQHIAKEYIKVYKSLIKKKEGMKSAS
ncbi:MAG: glycosyltransferase family 4 protein [Candidatus Anstonellales archaeon]